MNRAMQANVIIHSHSAASAMVAGTAAMVPLLGPIVGDMVRITAITVSMCIVAIFAVHNRWAVPGGPSSWKGVFLEGCLPGRVS